MRKQDLPGFSSPTTFNRNNCLLLSYTTSSSTSISKALSALKTRITTTDKALLRKRFENFKSKNQKDFWYLQATIQQTEDVDPLSIEEKVMNFAMECEYYHPSQSLVLDLGDKNWTTIFTEEELDELCDVGRDLPLSVPEELNECFQGLSELKTIDDAYKYSRKIDIDDPRNELLKVWFCNEVEKVSTLFLKTGSFRIDHLKESDQLYLGFVLYQSKIKIKN